MVLNRQRRVPVAVKPLERFLSCVRTTLDFSQDVSVCFVSDAVIARMNAAYRRKNGPTDVLSFPFNGHARRGKQLRSGASSSEAGKSGRLEKTGRTYLGDIAIAPETARRNARRARRTLPVELRILILHGVLHLLGYDHETDRGEMVQLERKLRRQLALE
jgi:probable rRNA maturation factor